MPPLDVKMLQMNNKKNSTQKDVKSSEMLWFQNVNRASNLMECYASLSANRLFLGKL
jgi:hypothetical protein